MGFDKAEIIAGTLRTQAAKHADIAKAARKDLTENDGAAQAMHQLSKQMPSFAAEIEKRIAADTDMSSETAEQVRVYSKNIIARIQAMCDGNAVSLRNAKLICEGRAQASEQAALALMKDADTEIAFARNREEQAQAMQAKADAEAAEELAEKSRLAKIAVAAKKKAKKTRKK